MDNFIFYAPTKVIFGRGSRFSLGGLLANYGFRKILIHYGGGSVKRGGLLAELVSNLQKAGISHVELGGVKPNPELALAREGIRLCKAENIDMILAVGGGSVIDSAKLIAVGAVTEDDPWLFSSKEKTPVAALPLGAVLTLAASGSEMSASAVITNEDGRLKRGYNSDFNRPLFSICDPELTYTVPPYQTACGITDIFMHTAERYFSDGEDTPISDRMAEALMKTVLEYGPKAIDQPSNYEARATLMWAGSLSHNDLTGCGRRLFFPVHQIEHELSGLFPRIAHGAGLAALMPAWMRYVYQADLWRFVRFASEVMNIDINYENPELTALAGIDALERYFKDIGMPIRLRELGITDDSRFEEMADKCLFFGARKLTAKKVLDKEDIIAIYRAALG